ncbi:hypothetical protein HRbin02_01934 [Candidatus Calditenuaceae archaeon HR02]|nr:hypothetical protein HRbin02_01934 [Candidatus Calditenuaceae archaeon HR02]
MTIFISMCLCVNHVVTTPAAARPRDISSEYYPENLLSAKTFRVPTSLPSLCVRKGRSVAELTAIAPDLSGLIVILSSIASKKSVDVLGGSLVKVFDGGLLISLFVDYTDSGLSPEGIEHSLGGIGVVESLSVNGALAKGVAVNSHMFPLMMGDKRAVVFAVDYFCDMMEHLRERLGEAANALLYDMGHKYGEAFARSLRTETSLTGDELVRLSLAEVQASGWCVLENYQADANKMVWRLSVKELFECSKRRPGASVNRSHFFRGFLSGLFEEAFGLVNISCVETLCQANVADACDFALWV